MSPATALPPTIPALHALAEHVLAAGLYAATGRIGLRAAPGGFGTPEHAESALGGRWSVSGAELVVADASGARRAAAITTLGEAGAFFGVTPGMPESVYAPVTPLDPDARLVVDPAVASAVGEWLALGQEVLTRLGAHHPDDGPTEAQLWPEHFDLGSTLAEVNYGCSPGDSAIGEPYAYVGPWSAQQGAFWNQPFGAARTWAELVSADAVLAFFEEGRSLALGR